MVPLSRTVARLVATSILLSASSVTAAPGHLSLAWDAPRDCPTGEDITRAVDHIVGQAQGASRDVTAHAAVEKTQSGYRVALSTALDHSTATRTFQAESCQAAAEATTVILALAVNPHASPPESPLPLPPPPSPAPVALSASMQASPAEPLASPAPPKPQEAAAPPPTAPVPDTPPSSARESRAKPLPPLAASLGTALDVGTLASIAPGLRLAAAWVPQPMRVELSFAMWAPQSPRLASGAGADMLLYDGAIHAAYVVPVKRFEIGPRAGLALEHVDASGFGSSTKYTPGTTWIALAAGALGAYPLAKHVWLRADLDLVVPMARPEFAVLQPAGPPSLVAQPSPVAVRGVVGVELRAF